MMVKFGYCRSCHGPFTYVYCGGRDRHWCSATCRVVAAREARASKRGKGPGRGRPRGGEYVHHSGYVIVGPVLDAERRYPTSWKSGNIARSHLVWNRAHPEDLVQPGEHVHHKNEIKDDDRLENLQKMTALEHLWHHNLGKRAPRRRVLCIECGQPFQGATSAKFCGQSCRDAAGNRKRRKARRAASAHPCKVCGTTVYAKSIYCKAAPCQRVRNAIKMKRWVDSKR